MLQQLTLFFGQGLLRQSRCKQLSGIQRLHQVMACGSQEPGFTLVGFDKLCGQFIQFFGAFFNAAFEADVRLFESTLRLPVNGNICKARYEASVRHWMALHGNDDTVR